MRRRLSTFLLGVSVLLGACGKRICRDHPASFELTLHPDPCIDATSIKTLEVRVEGAGATITRTFNIQDEFDDGVTGFNVDLADRVDDDFSASVTVIAKDAKGRFLGTGRKSLDGSNDACNFFDLSLECFDIAGQITVAEKTVSADELKVFGQRIETGANPTGWVFARLDDTFDQVISPNVPCTISGKTTYWERAWSIRRRPGPAANQRLILVRGNSASNCVGGSTIAFPPEAAGEIQLLGGWKVKTIQCAKADKCNGVPGETTVSWRSTNACGANCCACPEGASVNVDIVVGKN